MNLGSQDIVHFQKYQIPAYKPWFSPGSYLFWVPYILGGVYFCWYLSCWRTLKKSWPPGWLPSRWVVLSHACDSLHPHCGPWSKGGSFTAVDGAAVAQFEWRKVVAIHCTVSEKIDLLPPPSLSIINLYATSKAKRFSIIEYQNFLRWFKRKG